jgi:hypothetical protein
MLETGLFLRIDVAALRSVFDFIKMYAENPMEKLTFVKRAKSLLIGFKMVAVLLPYIY